jgi:hypothetical protein
MGFKYKYMKSLLDFYEIEDEDEQQDFLFDSHHYEHQYALRLILCGFMNADIFNNGEWLAEIRDRLRSPKTTPSTLPAMCEIAELLGMTVPQLEPKADLSPDRHWGFNSTEEYEYLNQQWKALAPQDDSTPSYRDYVSEFPNKRNNTPIEDFVDDVTDGRYPTPEQLLSIAKCFQLYLEAEGKITLEEVFFGKPRKRSGNYSKRRRTDLLCRRFNDIVIEETFFTNNRVNLENLASKFLWRIDEEEGKTDESDEYCEASPDLIESFLRQYRRWKKENPELTPQAVSNKTDK